MNSLQELRRTTAAGDGFIGFGNPVLGGEKELPPLPDTADELLALADALGRDKTRVFLGPEATERQVRALDAAGELAEADVLAFATHGLVAGQLDAFSEPGLVLTPPQESSEGDDGLLSASEAAELDLDADWVLLSACNTAAADGTLGAEGLSGLARAFFYAGARALLVSHWSVYSEAAVRLTTGTLNELRREPGLDRAEALRRTMVKLLKSGPNPHPAYWAPFVLVGG